MTEREKLWFNQMADEDKKRFEFETQVLLLTKSLLYAPSSLLQRSLFSLGESESTPVNFDFLQLNPVNLDFF